MKQLRAASPVTPSEHLHSPRLMKMVTPQGILDLGETSLLNTLVVKGPLFLRRVGDPQYHYAKNGTDVPKTVES